MTLDQIAAELGISRERVRQIEAVALRKFRDRLQKKLAGAGLEPADLLALADRHGQHPLAVAAMKVAK